MQQRTFGCVRKVGVGSILVMRTIVQQFHPQNEAVCAVGGPPRGCIRPITYFHAVLPAMPPRNGHPLTLLLGQAWADLTPRVKA